MLAKRISNVTQPQTMEFIARFGTKLPHSIFEDSRTHKLNPYQMF